MQDPSAIRLIMPRVAKVRVGDAVHVRSGTFAGFHGIARRVSEARVLVMVDVHGKEVPVEFDAVDVVLASEDFT